ncbi:MAG TPA: MmcQ/YjbR family DNA-binding protein [Gemmataceae bacterium]|nr:MmcQ/YjbR family DNA-binding protein [Gemmataceae bacterium]
MKPKGYDKALDRVRAICLALPEACEVEAWGHPTFRAGKKMFAGFGHESGGSNSLALGMKMGFERQDELLEDDRFFPTPYAAHQGWVSLRIDGKTDWAQVRELLVEAYREVAIKRMLKALNANS